MKWLKGEAAARPEAADEMREALVAAGFPGWEEKESAEGCQFVFYCAVTSETPSRIREIESGLGRAVSWTEVDDEDWAHAWKRFWKPLRIGRRIVVKPTWEPFIAGSDDLVLELDPGMAFGTGTHATTRMCVEWLESLVRGGERVLDVGTGSGILSLAALRLGASSAVAVDNDPIAVDTARANLALNGVDDRARVLLASGVSVVEGRFDVVVANIVADVIIALVSEVAPLLARGGVFVASGIIIEKVSPVRVSLDEVGLTEQEWRVDDEWASVCASMGEGGGRRDGHVARLAAGPPSGDGVSGDGRPAGGVP